MFVTTFYSFKGGVGRTLALANVGAELARGGRRVLLVDFDLEAPGLDTIPQLTPKASGPGLVDFISDYAATGRVPEAKNYLYEASLAGKMTGRIWVMPAGKRDGDYAKKLAHINWQRLYSEMNGFLLIDDLRRQWREELQPDYVLIDSRTGHTEVGGICTRQLPNAVVILFVPNQQNLVGLEAVVRAIREEKSATATTPIELLFVMSNVPDLDDEEEILRGMRAQFASKLKYRPLNTTMIHRYDSLSLLNQTIFTLERPKSRLAKEYRTLTERLIERNLDDREGVLRALDLHSPNRPSRRLDRAAMDKRIDQIRSRFPDDPEVLIAVSRLLHQLGRTNEAKLMLAHAISISNEKAIPLDADVLIDQAFFCVVSDERDRAAEYLMLALRLTSITERVALRALSLMQNWAPARLIEAIDLPAIDTLPLPSIARLAASLAASREGQMAAARLLSQASRRKDATVEQLEELRSERILVLIGLSQFEEAIMLFGAKRPEPASLNQRDAFNYAMAEWGHSGSPPREMLERVKVLDSGPSENAGGANYEQCLTIVNWGLGSVADARARLERAWAEISRDKRTEFSCWRYAKVPPDQFMLDLEELEQLLKGEHIVPQFMRKREVICDPK